MVVVSYLIVNALSPYNIILGRPTINAIRAFISIRYLVMKYPLSRGQVRTVQGDQKSAQECYQTSLAREWEELALVDSPSLGALDTDFVCLDPRLGTNNERLTPTNKLKEVIMGP